VLGLALLHLSPHSGKGGEGGKGYCSVAAGSIVREEQISSAWSDNKSHEPVPMPYVPLFYSEGLEVVDKIHTPTVF